MKILVVDDFIANVSILRIALTKIGHTVVTASDGVEAIGVLKSEPIDIVLTDWRMPNLDGLGLIRWIRASMQHQPVIIVITAYRSHLAEQQAFDAGADAFLIKPISSYQVGTIIADIYQKRAQTIEILRKTARPDSSEIPSESRAM